MFARWASIVFNADAEHRRRFLAAPLFGDELNDLALARRHGGLP
jgi:hypothetical protein